jgi:hypothetical protein
MSFYYIFARLRLARIAAVLPSLASLVLLLFCDGQLLAGTQGAPAIDQRAQAKDKFCFQNDDYSISVGIEGVIRLGKWVPITVKAKNNQRVKEILVETRDGQDKPVVYKCLPQQFRDASVSQGFIRMGRSQKSIVVTIETQSGKSEELTVPLGGVPVISSTSPIVLSIESGGSEVGKAIQSASTNEANETLVAKSVGDVSMLPRSWLGYDAVETIYLASNDDKQLAELSSEQVEALERWVREGGRLVVSTGAENTKKWFGNDSIYGRFVPGEVSGVGNFSNSSRLESFVGSRNQLISIGGESIASVKLSNTQGKIWVSDENKQPLIIQQPKGFGDVIFIAFDLKSKKMASWDSFSTLIRVLQEIKKGTDRDGKKSIASIGGAAGQAGFSDLIGQLYAPLEQFSKVGFIPFTAIAILISLYILCIGPIDYFLLRKFLGKMELTWITFPFFSLLFCGLAVGLSWLSRPASMQVNQLEIVDIDSVTQECRGSVWSNIYSPLGRTLNIEIAERNGLNADVDEATVTWHGQPGQGLGGMNTTATVSVSIPSYSHPIDAAQNKSRLESFSIPVASSRSLFSRWHAKIPAAIRSGLKYRENVEQLFGTVKNPLDVELTNVRLYHGSWAYILDDSLGPGDAFDVETNSEDRPLSSILNRKFRSSEDKDKYRTSATRWQLTEMDTSRIAEVLMFYDAAGGKSYTGLSHDYQSEIDMSDVLMLGRAVLVGEIAQRPTSLKYSSGGQAIEDLEYDQVTTFVRIVLPVTTVRARQK